MSTDESRAYARERYAARCQDEVYRQKVRDWAQAAINRKKLKNAEAGVPVRARGRPRKYVTPVPTVVPEVQNDFLT